MLKIGLALFLIFALLAISPIALLSIWVFTSPVISNFLERSLFYSVFASKRIWDYQGFAIPGFAIRELFQYDRIVLTSLFLSVLFSGRYLKLKASRIDYLLFCLLFILFISSAFSNNTLHAIRTIIDTFGMYYIAYFLGKNLIRDGTQFEAFVNSVLLLGCILITIGLVESWVVGTQYRIADVYRITGPFRYWESMGATLAIILFFLWYKVNTILPSYRKTRILLKLLIVLDCFCILSTQTRTIMVAVIIGVLISAYKGRHILKTAIKKIVIFSILGVLIIAVVPEIITSTAFYQHTLFRETGESRNEGYTAAYRIFIKHPLFGVGLKNFQDEFINYVKEDELVYSQPGKTTLHNSYFVIAVECGLIGFLPMLLLVFLAFNTCNNYYELEGDINGKYWGLTTIAISSVYFLSPLSFDLFFLPTIDNKLYYLCLGITTGRYQRLA